MVLEEKRSFASPTFFYGYGAWGKALSCLYLISKWTTRRIWPFRLCLLFFRKFYWCYFFFRACCLYVENPLGGSIALCVFMHRYAWSGTSCRCKYLFCSPLLIGVRGRPWYSFWPCFWSSYLKMKDAAFHGLFFGPLFEHHCGSLMKRSVIGNIFLCYHPGGGSKCCPLFGSFIFLELDPAGWS